MKSDSYGMRCPEKIPPSLRPAVYTGWTGADETPHRIKAGRIGMAVVYIGGALVNIRAVDSVSGIPGVARTLIGAHRVHTGGIRTADSLLTLVDVGAFSHLTRTRKSGVACTTHIVHQVGTRGVEVTGVHGCGAIVDDVFTPARKSRSTKALVAGAFKGAHRVRTGCERITWSPRFALVYVAALTRIPRTGEPVIARARVAPNGIGAGGIFIACRIRLALIDIRAETIHILVTRSALAGCSTSFGDCGAQITVDVISRPIPRLRITGVGIAASGNGTAIDKDGTAIARSGLSDTVLKRWGRWVRRVFRRESPHAPYRCIIGKRTINDLQRASFDKYGTTEAPASPTTTCIMAVFTGTPAIGYGNSASHTGRKPSRCAVLVAEPFRAPTRIGLAFAHIHEILGQEISTEVLPICSKTSASATKPTS